MRWLLGASAILLAAGAATVGAAEPRKPTARWVVQFDDAQCIASRNYGTDASPLYLVLKSPPVGGVVQVGVVRPGNARPAEQLDGEFAIDGQRALPVSILAFTVNEQNHRGYLINMPVQQFAPTKSAKVLSIRTTGDLDERFAISGIEPLMKVMDDCVADLRKVWNVTPENASASTLKEWPQGDVTGLVRSWDYPAVAIDKGQSGTAALVLLINESGRVADCTVIETSGAASLDGQSCALLAERGRFKPAVGLDGKPAKGSFVQRITWRVKS